MADGNTRPLLIPKPVGLCQQFDSAGGEGYAVLAGGFHAGGGDRPGGFGQVDLVPSGASYLTGAASCED